MIDFEQYYNSLCSLFVLSGLWQLFTHFNLRNDKVLNQDATLDKLVSLFIQHIISKSISRTKSSEVLEKSDHLCMWQLVRFRREVR